MLMLLLHGVSATQTFMWNPPNPIEQLLGIIPLIIFLTTIIKIRNELFGNKSDPEEESDSGILKKNNREVEPSTMTLIEFLTTPADAENDFKGLEQLLVEDAIFQKTALAYVDTLESNELIAVQLKNGFKEIMELVPGTFA